MQFAGLPIRVNDGVILDTLYQDGVVGLLKQGSIAFLALSPRLEGTLQVPGHQPGDGCQGKTGGGQDGDFIDKLLGRSIGRGRGSSNCHADMLANRAVLSRAKIKALLGRISRPAVTTVKA